MEVFNIISDLFDVKSFWNDEELFTYSFICCVPWFVIGETFYYICDVKHTLFNQSDTENDSIVTMKSRQYLQRRVLTFVACAAFNTAVIYTSTQRHE